MAFLIGLLVVSVVAAAIFGGVFIRALRAIGGALDTGDNLGRRKM